MAVALGVCGAAWVVRFRTYQIQLMEEVDHDVFIIRALAYKKVIMIKSK